MPSESISMFRYNTNMDYPVMLYYVQLEKMFMQRVPWHWHDELEIDLVRSGTANFLIGEKQYRVSAGSAILLNGRHLHSVYSDEPEHCVILSIMFHANFLFDSPKSFLYLKYCEQLMNNPDFTAIPFSGRSSRGNRSIESIQNVFNINLAHEYGYELLTKSYLCNFWMQLLDVEIPSDAGNASQKSVDEERTKNGILYIRNHYPEALSLDDIAESIHISKSECCRCFKRSIQSTPFEYLMTYRIYASAVKMQRFAPEAESFAMLAGSTGFHNASYYNKIFKKYMGMTPSRYRDVIRTAHRDALSPYGIPLVRM